MILLGCLNLILLLALYLKIRGPVVTHFVSADPREVHGLRARCRQLEYEVSLLTRYTGRVGSLLSDKNRGW